ncbi:hypothetical protein SCLCIDRAFT_776732 [Scleroderma citrinum Foug A]|uniref:Uncharacterized protein n=1 Tax=Scleroderma citrinum Foug A TaxID=1036808 RepID=A0A0C3E457_9AGAM|nr:hypothetical protein SCLCIDRAFT_776732 [Scleroderma citrinum Foug A]
MRVSTLTSEYGEVALSPSRSAPMIPLSLVHSSSETCKKIFISSVRRTFRLWR